MSIKILETVKVSYPEIALPNVYDKESGLVNIVVWYSPKFDNHNHPRIKVWIEGNKKKSEMEVRIGTNPNILRPLNKTYSDLGYTSDQYEKIWTWIVHNKTMLGKYWQCRRDNLTRDEIDALSESVKELPSDWKVVAKKYGYDYTQHV